jgi:nitrogen fixation protein
MAGNVAEQMETLESMQEKHRKIARYRLVVSDWAKPRGKQLTEIERGLTWEDVTAKRDLGNARLKVEGKDGWGGQMYGVELTNGWECMAQAGRDRQMALGKVPEDFNR